MYKKFSGVLTCLKNNSCTIQLSFHGLIMRWQRFSTVKKTIPSENSHQLFPTCCTQGKKKKVHTSFPAWPHPPPTGRMWASRPATFWRTVRTGWPLGTASRDRWAAPWGPATPRSARIASGWPRSQTGHTGYPASPGFLRQNIPYINLIFFNEIGIIYSLNTVHLMLINKREKYYRFVEKGLL